MVIVHPSFDSLGIETLRANSCEIFTCTFFSIFFLEIENAGRVFLHRHDGKVTTSSVGESKAIFQVSEGTHLLCIHFVEVHRNVLVFILFKFYLVRIATGITYGVNT